VALAWLAAAPWAGAQTVGVTQVPEPESGGTVAFPDDHIFSALVADPKEPGTFISFLRGTFRTLDDPAGAETNVAAIGVGDSFGLVRFGGPSPGDGLQFDVIGVIFAQFDVGSSSTDLINADYIIGLPVTFRRGAFSIRTKLYHQSSHLGDEFLLRDTGIDRENLSFESIEVLASLEAGPLRVYGGGEHLLRREPEAVAAKIFHGGLEVRTRAAAAAQLVAGVDIKAPKLGDWSPAASARAGVAFRRAGSERDPGRLITFSLEWYEGPSPYGQFFQDDISYVGVGVHLGL
jgi:hypothetical protein